MTFSEKLDSQSYGAIPLIYQYSNRSSGIDTYDVLCSVKANVSNALSRSKSKFTNHFDLDLDNEDFYNLEFLLVKL